MKAPAGWRFLDSDDMKTLDSHFEDDFALLHEDYPRMIYVTGALLKSDLQSKENDLHQMVSNAPKDFRVVKDTRAAIGSFDIYDLWWENSVGKENFFEGVMLVYFPRDGITLYVNQIPRDDYEYVHKSIEEAILSIDFNNYPSRSNMEGPD